MTAPALSRLHVAIFLLSLMSLVFEFAQTRLFSATLDYHLTFLVLSGALLGVGAGAAMSARFDSGARRPSSTQLAVAAAATTLLSLLVETHVDPLVVGMLAAVVAGYVTGVLPLLFASWVIVRALRDTPGRSGSLYAADLAGAATGSALGYLTIGLLGDQGLYGVGIAGALVAGGILTRGRGRRVLAAALAVAVVAVLSTAGDLIAPPQPGPLKALEVGRERQVARWDPLARIDVSGPANGGDANQYAFLVDSSYAGPRPNALAMQLDMGALTPIVEDGVHNATVFDASILAAPYELHPKTVLIVGPGGGIDLLVGLRRGATSVSAVEVNRTEVALMRGMYAGYSGGVYLDPRVHIYEDEARSFIRRSTDRYDLIPITVVDSFAALSAGAYALTENYLYTTEAMQDFLGHLTPDGALAVSRWYRDPPLEMQRLLSVARTALSQRGVTDPAHAIAVLRYGNFGLAIIRPRGFQADEMARLRAFAADHHFVVALDAMAPSGELATTSTLSATTDDRPFFFDNAPLSSVLGGAPLPYGYAVLLVTLIVSLALAIGLVLAPTWPAARRASGRAVPPGTVVALAIGLGFLATEVVVLQRLTLYLGQPSLALSIGVAALLLGAASGSAISRVVPGGIRTSALVSAIVLAVVLGALALVGEATLAAPLLVRIAIASVAALLVGLPLGTVFPRLVQRVGRIDAALVSWVWAANGTASVIAAVLATALALTVGFTGVAVAACLCYVVAAAVPS